MFRELETERLKFRDLNRSDIDNLQDIFTDPVAMEYYPSTKTESETLEWIDWNIKSYQENGYGLWALINKCTGDFVGQCGLILQLDVDGIDEIEVAYLLVRKYWGNGFATEAAAASRDFAFSKLACKRVISLIDPKNLPSLRVAERNGLVYEKNVTRWEKSISVYVQPNTSYNKSLQQGASKAGASE